MSNLPIFAFVCVCVCVCDELEWSMCSVWYKKERENGRTVDDVVRDRSAEVPLHVELLITSGDDVVEETARRVLHLPLGNHADRQRVRIAVLRAETSAPALNLLYLIRSQIVTWIGVTCSVFGWNMRNCEELA
jgi:hypothetical protein